ncbi:ABC transporter substrate-binding protein [Mesorhizobium loti]|nr:ABC transporter substrate-binding protein [Mesorhizobium loti]
MASAVAILCFGSPARATDALNVMAYGGAYQKSQDVYFNAFAKATGVTPVVESADDAAPKLKAMVEANAVTWDIIQGETSVIIDNCNNGNLEPFDWNKLDKSKFIPLAVQECGVGTIISASIIAYDADRFPGKRPATVADFWDVKTFPGKRGMRRKAITTLEFALYADGVAPGEIYKVLRTEEGVARAFAKLDQIKKDIVWWESSSSAPQLLGSGEVTMSTGWNGRITNARQQDGKNFVIIWDGQNYDGDFFAIVKGAPHKDLAYKFIETAMQPQLQAEQQKYISYGPTLLATTGLLSADKLKDLPTSPENLKTAIPNDAQFWADNGEELEQRFISWLNAG